jgi:transposase
LWLLRSGARYKDRPKHFPSGSTCWFRLQFWAQQGALRKLHQQLLRLLDKKGKLNLKECFSDGTFSAAKKRGGDKVGKTKKGKGTWNA